jgi:suppressor of tumorigenicity protein 13
LPAKTRSPEPKAEPSKADDAEEMPEAPAEESEESDVELDMEGVVESDVDEAKPMGDPTKELSEEDMDAFDAKRGDAMAAYSEGEWEKAIGLFTEAIEMNATSAMPFAKRAVCSLKLSKPNACIRDCDRAIEINPDNAAAHKFRGRAHR